MLHALSKLLMKLSALTPSATWSARWLLDFPLLARRILVSDICFWQPDLGIVDGVTRHLVWLARIRQVFYAVNKNSGLVTMVFPPILKSKFVLSYADYFTTPGSDGAASWVPDCLHCVVSSSSRSLNASRRYWHPAREVITPRMGTPLRLPVHLRLPPESWRLFWSLDMPPKAFSSWWRLLHDCVAHRSWCHRVVSAKVPSPTCALCGLAPADLHTILWWAVTLNPSIGELLCPRCLCRISSRLAWLSGQR
ncbi:hypothetical protein [Parasitella parasitica]|uniref:Reverse transcriptase zinc-binding domain-containing protein n=1 Tax=Parasitella parasitica TaxID=35722 RepID=A0A0B7NDM2_9FUNG|nr:hypothetical protein [Parasitella parasitica]